MNQWNERKIIDKGDKTGIEMTRMMTDSNMCSCPDNIDKINRGDGLIAPQESLMTATPLQGGPKTAPAWSSQTVCYQRTRYLCFIVNWPGQLCALVLAEFYGE